METLKWSIDRSARIGAGGFGSVYNATDPDGNPRAAKIVLKAPGADRDLLAVTLDPSEYLVPVLHIEETDREIILYMPRAEGSLRARLISGEPILATEALDILQQIALGLIAMEGKIVHRDLKPENILLLNGKWAICDFGISRYAEAATAADTQKFSMTAPYAAPEQWRQERATSATDVYAFGVIAHEVLGGERPFLGPSMDEYRDQHLNHAPPKLQTTKKLVSLVQECLFKAPGARPSAQNLDARLKSAGVDASQPGASALADAQQVVVETKAAEQRAAEEERTEQQRRSILGEAAMQLFEQINTELVEAIQGAAPAASIRQNALGTIKVEMGAATLSIAGVRQNPPLTSSFDVISYSSISLANDSGATRSHSLYFTNFDDKDSYQWYELAFCGRFGADFDREPCALTPKDGLDALQGFVGTSQLGWPVTLLQLGDLDTFVDQWAERLGRAAIGKFPRPSQLPERNPVSPRRR